MYLTPFLVVEDRREDARRVKVREPTPVDAPVDANQGNGVQVADDAVGLDRLVAHDLISSARATLIEPHDGRIVNALRRRKDTPDVHLFCPQPRSSRPRPLASKISEIQNPLRRPKNFVCIEINWS